MCVLSTKKERVVCVEYKERKNYVCVEYKERKSCVCLIRSQISLTVSVDIKHHGRRTVFQTR